MTPSTTYAIYCQWFLRTYGRPFAASEEQFNTALAAQPPTTPAKDGHHSPRYLDGEEDREGLYR